MWDPVKCSSVLRLVALPRGSVMTATDVTVGEMSGLRLCVLEGKGSAHLLLERAGSHLQLEIKGSVSLTEPFQLFLDVMVSAGRLKAQRQALETLDRLRGVAAPSNGSSETASKRLDLVLRALDGSLGGLSQREIAVGLFGRGRVDSDWGRGSDHLKSRVRRLVRRGRWLMEGGYLSFLR